MTAARSGANAGTYYIVSHDAQRGEWLVIGVFVAGDHSWVVGRWDTKDAAEFSAAEWTALEEDVAA